LHLGDREADERSSQDCARVERLRHHSLAKFGKKAELFAAESYDIVRLVAQAITAIKDEPVSGSGFPHAEERA
jgi:hypothetical protein